MSSLKSSLKSSNQFLSEPLEVDAIALGGLLQAAPPRSHLRLEARHRREVSEAARGPVHLAKR